jgi:hypothetical protein
MTRRLEDGLTREEQLLVPIAAYIKQLEQQASTLEWENDLEGCDRVLEHLGYVRQYQLETGSLYYPLF